MPPDPGRPSLSSNVIQDPSDDAIDTFGPDDVSITANAMFKMPGFHSRTCSVTENKIDANNVKSGKQCFVGLVGMSLRKVIGGRFFLKRFDLFLLFLVDQAQHLYQRS